MGCRWPTCLRELLLNWACSARPAAGVWQWRQCYQRRQRRHCHLLGFDHGQPVVQAQGCTHWSHHCSGMASWCWWILHRQLLHGWTRWAPQDVSHCRASAEVMPCMLCVRQPTMCIRFWRNTYECFNMLHSCNPGNDACFASGQSTRCIHCFGIPYMNTFEGCAAVTTAAADLLAKQFVLLSAAYQCSVPQVGSQKQRLCLRYCSTCQCQRQRRCWQYHLSRISQWQYGSHSWGGRYSQGI